MDDISSNVCPPQIKIKHRNEFLNFGSKGGMNESVTSTGCTALVLVNGATLLHDNELRWVQRAWKLFDIIICADGGTNRLYDASVTEEDRASMIPHHIIGDLDSAREEALAYYKNKGTIVTKNPNQDNTDLEKSLDLLCELRRNSSCSRSSPHSSTSSVKDSKMNVVVMGAFGGRFDQEMANCNCLFNYSNEYESMVLLGDGNCVTFLRGGTDIEHVIEMIPGLEGPGCALLPIGGTATSVTTSGLKWDVNNTTLRFGGLVSSSNRAADGNDVGGTISVKTSHPILWSCDLVL